MLTFVLADSSEEWSVRRRSSKSSTCKALGFKLRLRHQQSHTPEHATSRTQLYIVYAEFAWPRIQKC